MSSAISIIIPCYNAGGFIAETISSVLSQSLMPKEVIVVDDGSTDHTEAIVREFMNSPVRYVRQHNQGVSAARNNGLAMASGDYFLFLDADDCLEPDFLKARVEVLENNSAFLFACSEVLTVDETNKRLGKILKPVCIDVAREIGTYQAGYSSCPSNYLIRKTEATSKLRFHPDLSNAADRFFLLQLSQLGQGCIVSGASRLLYRIHKGSMSATIQPKNIRDLIRFYQLVANQQLLPQNYRIVFKLKTFRISFSESILAKKPSLAYRSIFFILLKF